MTTEEDVVFVNAVGVEFRFNVNIDLEGATLMEVHVKKPSGAIVVWTAERYLTTTKIRYITTSASDLDQIGVWTFQPYVEKGPTFKHHGLAVEKEIFAEFAIVE
jgi:hypothetical protein